MIFFFVNISVHILKFLNYVSIYPYVHVHVVYKIFRTINIVESIVF